jgi:hypothetical protein
MVLGGLRELRRRYAPEVLGIIDASTHQRFVQLLKAWFDDTL